METYIYNKRFGTPVSHTIFPCGASALTASLKTQMVTTEFLFPVGCLMERRRTGVAHCLEHLLLKGKTPYGAHPALAPLMRKGVQYGAGTSYVHSEYWLAGLAEHFTEIECALLEILQHPNLADDILERERGPIIQEERDGASGEEYSLWERSILFPHERRLHLSVIGRPEDVREITVDDLQSFIDEEYKLSDAVFLCTGGVSHEQHIEILNTRLGDALHRSSSAASRRPQILPLTLAHAERRNERQKNAIIKLYFHGPQNAYDGRILGLAEEILCYPRAGILSKNLRLDHGLVYGVSATSERGLTPVAKIITGTDEEHLDRIQELIWEGVEALIDGDYPEDLLEMVMAQRRIFFATRDENLHRNRILKLLEHCWFEQDFEDEDPRNTILSATRQEISRIARKYYRKDAYGVIKHLPA
jgi:predicted Zn-dependent peptidase